jgi:hypothetical protein
MSVEGFNVLRSRTRRLPKGYQVIIDDEEKVDLSVVGNIIKTLNDFLEDGKQYGDFLILMPPGTHLARVK